MSSVDSNSHLQVIEIRETDLNTKNDSSNMKIANGNTVSPTVTFETNDVVRLEVPVPEHTQSGRSLSLASGTTNSTGTSSRRKSVKWLFKNQRESRTNTESSGVRSQISPCGSMLSVHSQENEGSSYHVSRRKSMMHGIIRRGRTIRKTMKAMHINEAEHPGSEEEAGRAGIILTTEQRLRMYVLREIVDTEEDYTKLLQFIVDVMIPDLNQCAEDSDISSVSCDTVAAMLSNIKDIHALHVKFLAGLKEATNPYPYHTNRIGKVFLCYKEEFRAYGKYCTNFTNAQKISYELETDARVLKQITEWMEKVASKTRKFLHLEGFIISPVQRLCKYPLLLRELKKFTSESHSDFEGVTEAMKMMEDITASVNESERRAIAMQAIKDLDDACDSWEKNGCLTKQGFMTKRGGSVKTWNIRWFTLRGYKLSYFHEPTDTKPLGVLDLTSYKGIEEDATYTGRPFCFGIKMRDRMFYMYCVNEREKQEWMSILNWKISCIDRARRQAHRPLETVIFASLASFLNPKGQQADFKDDEIEAAPSPERRINKRRSKSFFSLSFRSRQRRPRVRSEATKPTEKKV